MSSFMMFPPLCEGLVPDLSSIFKSSLHDDGQSAHKKQLFFIILRIFKNLTGGTADNHIIPDRNSISYTRNKSS